MSSRAAQSGGLDPVWSLRMKSLANILVHILYACLYAFEHTCQVCERNEVSNTYSVEQLLRERREEEVFTPVGNFIIMGLNLVLTLLVLHISINIDSQIEHAYTPRFMPTQRNTKPSYRYRNLYWIFSALVIVFIMAKDKGLSVVEHPLFVISSICLLSYAPFWLSKAIDRYEETTQERELAEVDSQALRCLEQMSLSYRSSFILNTQSGPSDTPAPDNLLPCDEEDAQTSQ